jgi:hypothetical protein
VCDPLLVTGPHHLVVDLPPLRPALLGAARLLLETVVVPTVLLGVLMHLVGESWAIAAAVGWCYLVVMVRWVRGHQLPGTLLLCTGLLTGRAAVALWMSSAFVFLVQPVIGSVCMAVLFLGSAALGRPVTMRLARDFVALPSHVLRRWRVRRMFRDVAIIWGVSRVADAGISFGLLHVGLTEGLFARGVVSPILTLVTVGLCTYWGWRSLRSDGIRLRLTRRAVAG